MTTTDRPSTLPAPYPRLHQHITDALRAIEALHLVVDQVQDWSITVARTLLDGGRVLTVGNGGSAAHAQHLTAELVGRYWHERRGFSSLALHMEPVTLSAIANDYGVDECFARSVAAHGRAGDVLVAFSTSGESANVVKATRAARALGIVGLACTGPGPNTLATLADDAIVVGDCSTPTVQEAHQVLIHLLCNAVDVELGVQ